MTIPNVLFMLLWWQRKVKMRISLLVAHSALKHTPTPGRLAAIYITCSMFFATHRSIYTAVRQVTAMRWAQSQVVLLSRYHVHGQRAGSEYWCGSRTQRHIFQICLRQIRIIEGNKFPSAQLVSALPIIWQHVSTLEGHLQASSIK